MTDDLPAELVALEPLRATPTSVAEALERLVRIDTVTGWLGDVKAQIRDGYLTPTAEALEASTGGRFSVPVAGLGSVYRTDPQPKPLVSDREAFARWYVEVILEDDPDRDGDHLTAVFDDVCQRHLTATAPPEALLAFLTAHAEASGRRGPFGLDVLLPACKQLVGRIRTDVEWLVSGTLLEDLLDAKRAELPSGSARLKLVGGDRVIDVTTSEPVPGVAVQPAGDKTLTVKPDADAKRRLRAELNDLLGPAQLR